MKHCESIKSISFYEERQIVLGLHLVLVTLYRWFTIGIERERERERELVTVSTLFRHGSHPWIPLLNIVVIFVYIQTWLVTSD